MPDKGIHVKATGECPCGGTFEAGFETESGDPALLHSMPPCQDFINKSLDGFLKWVREHGKN